MTHLQPKAATKEHQPVAQRCSPSSDSKIDPKATLTFIQSIRRAIDLGFTQPGLDLRAWIHAYEARDLAKLSINSRSMNHNNPVDYKIQRIVHVNREIQDVNHKNLQPSPEAKVTIKTNNKD